MEKGLKLKVFKKLLIFSNLLGKNNFINTLLLNSPDVTLVSNTKIFIITK